MSAPKYDDEPGAEQPFITHLIELRDRLIRGLVAVLVAFLVLFPFSNTIYTYVAQPLMGQLPTGSTMIATEVATPFLTPFRLALVAAVFVAMPYLLYQLWSFVAPGLYRHEKRLAVPLLISSIILFYVGVAFAYYIVFPLIFAFLIGTAPEGVAVMTDIAKYLDFVLALFFAFGLAFEIPIATVLVVIAGFVTPEQLVEKRPYVIVGAFVIGAFLTPPDVFSQTLLAVPMWLLFEAGVYFARVILRQPKAGLAEDSGTPTPPAPASPAVPALAAPPPAAPTESPPSGPGSRPWSPPGEGLTDHLARGLVGVGDLVVGAEIDGAPAGVPGRFVPLTPEQMEAELDAIEQAERGETAAKASPPALDDEGPDSYDLSADDHPDALPAAGRVASGADTTAVERRTELAGIKLRRVYDLRDHGDPAGARTLLYEVLAEGDADQRMVARNILNQLDT
jgi:sec-independent protein translocase protein TatC